MAEVESTIAVEEQNATEEIVIGGAAPEAETQENTETAATEETAPETDNAETGENAAETEDAAIPAETTAAESGDGNRLTGKVVKWIVKKGYGFIKVEGDATEIFCHRNDLKDARFDLNIGENVDFVKEIRNDKPRALDVKGDGTGTKPKVSGRGRGGFGMMYGSHFNPYAYAQMAQMMGYGYGNQGWGGYNKGGRGGRGW